MGKLLKILRAETWVMLAGGGVLLVVVLNAMIPGDFEQDVATARSGPAQNNAHLHRQTQIAAQGVTRSGKAPVNAPAAVAVQWTQPGVAQAQTVRQLQPLKMAATEHYQGKILQVVNRDPGGWGQIHVIINNGAKQQDVSLAPEWYLSFQGCKVTQGARVDGEGFRFDKVRPNAPLYARHVTVGGVRCRLRSLDGVALWSDQLR